MTSALLAFDRAGDRLFDALRRAVAGRIPSLAALETPPWVGLAVAIGAWILIVVFSEPWGRLWGTGQDARCYWQATLANPYLHSDWNDPIAYVYSPAFLQLVSPLTALPWQAFMGVWSGLLIGAVRFLTGPRLLAAGLLFPFTAMEVAGGNVSLLLAVAIVIGFRWPAAWSLVLGGLLLTAVSEVDQKVFMPTETVVDASNNYSDRNLYIDSRFQLPDGTLATWEQLVAIDPSVMENGPNYPNVSLMIPGERYRAVEAREALAELGIAALLLVAGAVVVMRRRPG